MISDKFNTAVSNLLVENSKKLLAHQYTILTRDYNQKTGVLARFLSSGTSAKVSPTSIELPYPIYIRFMDMKRRYSAKKKAMVVKKPYFPIYNRYVFGYLKSDIWKKLNAVVPDMMIRSIEMSFPWKKGSR